jgi:hypothetical protein
MHHPYHEGVTKPPPAATIPGMHAVKRIQGTVRGFLAGLILCGLWGAAVTGAILVFTSVGHALTDGEKLRYAAEIGGIAGGGLFLFFQPPLGKVIHGMFSHLPHATLIFSPLYLAYYVGAFPGLLLARLVKQVAWAPRVAAAAAVAAPGAPATSRGCPWEGRIVATEVIEFRDQVFPPNETVFEIHEDWRVSTAKLRFWGWVDPQGKVHEGAGDPSAAVDAPVVGVIGKGRQGVGCYIGERLVGVLKAV